MTFKPQIYAELLPNIRQVSVAVSLPTPAEPASTSASVTDGGTVLRIHHAGTSTSLRLPGQVASVNSQLPLLSEKAVLEPSWRLPLVATASALRQARESASGSGPTPWSAKDLLTGSEVRCRGCEAVVVPKRQLREWKDLPSENWAEMMEFWHCHKPDHHHGHGHEDGANGHSNHESVEVGDGKASEEKLAHRGYGAASAISAQAGVGFVDLMAFHFTEADCSGLMYSPSTFDRATPSVVASNNGATPRSLNVFCKSCRTQLGHFDFRTSSVTVMKWQISCETTTSLLPSVSECLAAALVATVARSGSSKSLIMPMFGVSAADTSDTAVVHLWVLNGHIRYASNRREHIVSAIKLLYRAITKKEGDEMLEQMTSDAQEINIPQEAILRVIEGLEESNGLLPAKERLFKEWKVGLLERCDDTG